MKFVMLTTIDWFIMATKVMVNCCCLSFDLLFEYFKYFINFAIAFVSFVFIIGLCCLFVNFKVIVDFDFTMFNYLCFVINFCFENFVYFVIVALQLTNPNYLMFVITDLFVFFILFDLVYFRQFSLASFGDYFSYFQLHLCFPMWVDIVTASLVDC